MFFFYSLYFFQRACADLTRMDHDNFDVVPLQVCPKMHATKLVHLYELIDPTNPGVVVIDL